MEAIILLLMLVHIKGQEDLSHLGPRPERCDKPADFMIFMFKLVSNYMVFQYTQCCVFPPFFTREIAKTCGAIFGVNFIDNDHNVTAFTRTTLTDCDHWRCVLKKYGFLTADDSLDDEKYFVHLDKWAQLNLQFTTVIKNAQVHCKNNYRIFMPLKACEFFKIHGCIRNFVNVDCPVIIPTSQCREKKMFFDECRAYFL